jgi:hypothetical protein
MKRSKNICALQNLSFTLAVLFALPFAAISQEFDRELDSIKIELQKIKREWNLLTQEEPKRISEKVEIEQGPRSKFFMSYKTQLNTYVNSSYGSDFGIMVGWEIEFGGFKREKLLFTGTQSFAIGTDFGWGGGVFLGRNLLCARLGVRRGGGGAPTTLVRCISGV